MLTNLLFIITGLLGFLTTTIILIWYKSNRFVNYYLIIPFILISTRFLLNGIYHIGQYSHIEYYYIDYNNSLIVVIPCFYLYFKNLILDNKNFISKNLLHFILPIVFIISKSISSKVYPSLHVNFVFCILFFLYALTYCYLTYRLLNKNTWIKKGEIKAMNKQNQLISNWTFYLLTLLVLNTIRLFISLYLQIFSNNHSSDQRFLWIAAILWISIFFKILITPQILYGYQVFNDLIEKEKISNLVLNTVWNLNSNTDLNNEQDSKLKDKVYENITQYISKIEEISVDIETFRDPKFSLTDLASKINIPRSHLNYLFKYHSKISFSEYKKAIRIHHAMQLIDTNYLKTNTLDSLAKHVGFASYNPFFTSFKNITGNSPQKYISQLNE